MSKNKGFTLVELLISLSILSVLAAIIVGIINPIALMNKAKDSTRKKDLSRIRIAFEEYYSDKGCYPDSVMITQLTNKSNCGSSVFQPWLFPWPCDPNKEPYKIEAERDSSGNIMTCPRWFKVYANLENKQDKEIPLGWYEMSEYFYVSGNYSKDQINYGISSSNVVWNEFRIDNRCKYFVEDHTKDLCNIDTPNGCKGAPSNRCSGNNCYAFFDGSCNPMCKVSCCGADCI